MESFYCEAISNLAIMHIVQQQHFLVARNNNNRVDELLIIMTRVSGRIYFLYHHLPSHSLSGE
jgi:hypothetical protein